MRVRKALRMGVSVGAYSPAGLSLSATVHIPVYQYVDGTQLGDDFNVVFGFAYGFMAF